LLEPRLLVAARELRLRFVGERDEVLEMPAIERVVLAESFERVLADDLEHREALVATADEALIHEHRKIFERRDAHGLRRRERPAAGEDAQACKQLLRARLEQVVAPVECHA
jgi:hypothetical protein